MNLEFDFQKSTYDLDCMKYSTEIIFMQGSCVFTNTYYGTAKELRKLSEELKISTQKLEDFLSTIDANEFIE